MPYDGLCYKTFIHVRNCRCNNIEAQPQAQYLFFPDTKFLYSRMMKVTDPNFNMSQICGTASSAVM